MSQRIRLITGTPKECAKEEQTTDYRKPELPHLNTSGAKHTLKIKFALYVMRQDGN